LIAARDSIVQYELKTARKEGNRKKEGGGKGSCQKNGIQNEKMGLNRQGESVNLEGKIIFPLILSALGLGGPNAKKRKTRGKPCGRSRETASLILRPNGFQAKEGGGKIVAKKP